MKKFTTLSVCRTEAFVKLEFTVSSTKYRILLPNKYYCEGKVIDYVWNNFDTLVQPDNDFTVPDVDFEKIMKEE